MLSKFGLPPGKVDSLDRALHHYGDDLEGDKEGEDGLDNEIITVDLNRINQSIHQSYKTTRIQKNRNILKYK